MEETVILYEKVNKKRVNKKQEEVISQLEKLNYAKHENSYNFLLHMRIDSFTEENITKLRKQCDDLKEKITNLTNTSPHSLWANDIADFQKEYNDYIVNWSKK